MEKKGLYIVIEGIDGSGKTTQLRTLINNLRLKGFACTTVVEPGGTPPGMEVREILIGDDLEEYQTPKSQVLGYNYARAMLMPTVQRLLGEGVNVFSDRCFFSTFTYQHHGEGEDFDDVKYICEYAVGDTMPDHVFVLDVSFTEAKKRMLARGGLPNHYDKKPEEFFEKLSNGYVELAKVYSNMVTKIDGEQSEEAIAEQILKKTLYLFQKKRGETYA